MEAYGLICSIFYNPARRNGVKSDYSYGLIDRLMAPEISNRAPKQQSAFLIRKGQGNTSGITGSGIKLGKDLAQGFIFLLNKGREARLTQIILHSSLPSPAGWILSLAFLFGYNPDKPS